MEIIYKKKYLIINEEQKILIFKYKKRFLFPTILFPTILLEKNKEKCEKVNKQIVHKCLNEQGSVKLHEYHRNIYENNDKSIINKKYIKRYYVTYHEFSDCDYEEIYNIALQNNYVPYMAKIEEISYLIDMGLIDLNAVDAIYNLKEQLSINRKREKLC